MLTVVNILKVKTQSKPKPYNLTYFIRLFAVATFVDHKDVNKYIKPYKMCYIGGFITLFREFNSFP